ncbi:hypothetical protein MB901379_00023 [Mycobacterium basiliense]|uniref:Uncharacterized protein n=1 Tax=Mycobacterium basiliense TaxID=2094119 RepID=A0A3S4CRY6_9MYCO|nr:hypothetical protein MB901379_00023 [Mycobacterium basiliense]
MDNRDAIATGTAGAAAVDAQFCGPVPPTCEWGCGAVGWTRSVIPSEPIAAYRDAQRLAVGHDTWKCPSARTIGPPSAGADTTAVRGGARLSEVGVFGVQPLVDLVGGRIRHAERDISVEPGRRGICG